MLWRGALPWFLSLLWPCFCCLPAYLNRHSPKPTVSFTTSLAKAAMGLPLTEGQSWTDWEIFTARRTWAEDTAPGVSTVFHPAAPLGGTGRRTALKLDWTAPGQVSVLWRWALTALCLEPPREVETSALPLKSAPARGGKLSSTGLAAE